MVLKLILMLLLAQAAGPAAPQPAPDSLRISGEYLLQELPSPDRIWGVQEYQHTAILLDVMASSAPESLPRRLSPRSGALFARLVNLDNIAPIKRTELPAGARLELGLGILATQSSVLETYSQVGKSLPLVPLDAEIVDLLNFQLYLLESTFPLARDTMLNPSDSTLAPRKADYELIRQSMATVLFGALATLAEHSYKTSELLRLAKTLDEVMPFFLAAIPDSARAELPVRLTDMKAKESDPELNQLLTRLLQRANEAIPPK
ncbi:MAG TPA: hypothetical protein VN493_14265 [Thermoanaerobaculia bacterium]|nr:hypothetical protein [Thermoanaerobaculia bacterium]